LGEKVAEGRMRGETVRLAISQAERAEWMSVSRKSQRLRATILDRLDAKARASGILVDGGYHIDDLKESVRRDLRALLNTRCRAIGWSSELDELDKSLLSYGIPDFMGVNASSQRDLDLFLRKVEDVIRKFEPRFKTVKVSMAKANKPEDRVLRFLIKGELFAEPLPEPVTFETEKEPSSSTYEVRPTS
jgi:type VI secretion system protein ImpF